MIRRAFPVENEEKLRINFSSTNHSCSIGPHNKNFHSSTNATFGRTKNTDRIYAPEICRNSRYNRLHKTGHHFRRAFTLFEFLIRNFDEITFPIPTHRETFIPFRWQVSRLHLPVDQHLGLSEFWEIESHLWVRCSCSPSRKYKFMTWRIVRSRSAANF